jgi:adenylate cyclase
LAERSHTFLFSDLVGYTTLTAIEGDDRAAEVAIAFYTAVRELLNHHAAEEVKTMGDAMMVRADDPATGMCLGVEIVDSVAQVRGCPPVRVGVHTGRAVSRDGDWYGAAVNIAARLCAAAAGDQVLVSEAARQSAGSVPGVDYGDRRLHWVKNMIDPVPAYVAIGTAPSHQAGAGRAPWNLTTSTAPEAA